MLVTNITITDTARHVLDRRKSLFKPSAHGVFALSYTSRFTNPDGTTVNGFVPGWQVCAWSHNYLGPSPLVVRLAHGTEFHLIARFPWNVEERYIMDLLSQPHEIFSITPAV
ncbi:MAG: hypothetical protein JWQ89_2807 [Devosia sp.]|nr:hypothetical protein [Devosia sp.]